MKILKGLSIYAAQALLVVCIEIWAFRLHSYDLRVPFNYNGDSVVILMYIKGMLLNGWTFSIPQLSAPFEMSAAAFPVMTNFDWLIMKCISLLTTEPGLVLNLFWLTSIVLSAWTSTFVMNAFGVARFYSFAAGILYAFLPFALLRNVAHLNLVYYLVPLLAAQAIYLASALSVPIDKRKLRLISHDFQPT